MQVDPQYLRQNYASLSDEALLEIHREDLIEIAQGCYDDEVRQRRLNSAREATKASAPLIPDAETEPDSQVSREGEQPGWIEEGAEVYSAVIRAGVAPDVDNARAALEAAGIPCYMDIHEVDAHEEEPAESVVTEPMHEWRLIVPGNLNLQATSILERDIFNADFEANWRTHLEMLSDQEVRAMSPQVVFCGLFDRVERVTRVWNEELKRRQLTSKSS
jgi:hypothetical protein